MEKRQTGRRRIHCFSPRGKLFDLARKKVKLEETPLQSQVLIHTFHVKISEASRRCPIEMSYHDQQACVAGRVLTERTSGGQKRASIIVGAWCSIGTFVKNDQTVCRFLVDFFVRTMRGSISTRKPNGISAHSAILRLRGRENLHITT
jgi:hypothetical protein